jgi:hypothetical protein
MWEAMQLAQSVHKAWSLLKIWYILHQKSIKNFKDLKWIDVILAEQFVK